MAVGVVGGRGTDKLSEEGSDVGVMADDEDVFVGGAIAQEALELAIGGGGKKGIGDEDVLLVAGFGGDELGGLLAALERAGDDEVEARLEGVEHLGELEAVGLAVFVEGAFDVEERVCAANAGTGVAEDEEVHADLDGCWESSVWRGGGVRLMILLSLPP